MFSNNDFLIKIGLVYTELYRDTNMQINQLFFLVTVIIINFYIEFHTIVEASSILIWQNKINMTSKIRVNT